LNDHFQLAFIAMLFILVSCTPNITPASYPNPSIASLTMTELPEVIQLILTPRAEITLTHTPTPDLNSSPTPTETRSPFEPTPIQLPLNEGNYEAKYCNNPTGVSLPISDAQDLTDDEIATKLMSLYLDYYKNPQAPDFCRIDGYRIEKVFYHEGMTSQLVTQKGTFMRQVNFSIKLIQIPNYWIGIPGEIDQQNWLHISMALTIYPVQTDSVYKMHIEVGGG